MLSFPYFSLRTKWQAKTQFLTQLQMADKDNQSPSFYRFKEKDFAIVQSHTLSFHKS